MWPTGAPSMWTSSCAASSKSRKTASSPTSTRTWPSRTSCCSPRFPAGARPTCRPSRPPSSVSRTRWCATRTCRCCRWRASPGRARPLCSCSASRICSTSIAARWIPPRYSSSRRTRCSAATSTACCPISASAIRRSSPGRSSWRRFFPPGAAWARATYRLSACGPLMRRWPPSSSHAATSATSRAPACACSAGMRWRRCRRSSRTCRPARTARRSWPRSCPLA